MMVRVLSFRKWVVGAGSSSGFQSTSRSKWMDSKRLVGLPAAPRPLIGSCSFTVNFKGGPGSCKPGITTLRNELVVPDCWLSGSRPHRVSPPKRAPSYMRTILLLISAVTLFTTSGCLIREHDRDRGGYYGRPEYQHGEFRHDVDRDWNRDRDWDDRNFPHVQHY